MNSSGTKKNSISLDQILSREFVGIELGCGGNKRHANSIGIDVLKESGVDIVGDVFEVLADFPDNSVDQIWTYHFLEHIDDLALLMHEMARVCKRGALIEIVVPHFSNPFFYSDPTHSRAFGLYTMSYFCRDNIFQRKVPRYGIEPLFEIESVELVFKSFRPRYIRHILKKLIQALVNINAWTAEVYEEVFSSFISCYEIKYKLFRL